jgi:hypothetical protein
VDTVSPESTIKSGPSGTVDSGDVQLTFTSDEPSTFECKIDGFEYRSCTSPMNYSGLFDGEHTFWVKAKDEAGKVEDTPADRTWTVCRTADPSTSL